MKTLIMSGGSSKCAWTAGVILHLLKDLKINYDIFCGVSAGAIIAAFLAQYKTGEEELAATELAELWKNLTSEKIYKRWSPFGKLHVLWKNSFYDSSPLHDLIRNNISLDKIRASGKKVAIGTVSLSSGKYTVFDQTSDHLIEAVIGSASFPGLFAPISFAGESWLDGGVKSHVCATKALEWGSDDLDIIIASQNAKNKKFIDNPNIIDILKRIFDLSTNKIIYNDIEKVEMYNKLIMAHGDKSIKINILRPEYNLVDDLLDFSPGKINEMMNKGYLYAKDNYNKVVK